MVSVFLDLMPQTVTLFAATGTDGFNQSTFAAGVDYRAHVEERNQLVTDRAGQQVTSSAVVYLNSADAILPGGELLLPGGHRRVILAAQRIADETDYYYTAVYLQ